MTQFLTVCGAHWGLEPLKKKPGCGIFLAGEPKPGALKGGGDGLWFEKPVA